MLEESPLSANTAINIVGIILTLQNVIKVSDGRVKSSGLVLIPR